MSENTIDTQTLYDSLIRPSNPNGEHESSYRVLVTAVRLGKIKTKKDVEEMAARYKDYCEEWNNTFGSAEQVYISKENRMKSFGEFYAAGMHKSASFSKMDARYMYLFGQDEFSVIEKKHGAFKKRTESPWKEENNKDN